jgi:predicted ArsR family transcriptional regulator
MLLKIKIKDRLLQAFLILSAFYSKMPSFCFYIPRVSTVTSVSDVIRVFNTIGVVTRVDFTPLGKKPGFKENIFADVKSAFVHVAELFTHGLEVVNMIQTGRSYKIYPYSTDEYWTFAKAQNQVQDTMMNNAQIVQNCRYLEKKVEQQARKLEEQGAQLEEQAADISSLSEKLSSVQEVVYQLLGGLFCQKSQVQIMSDHIDFLYPVDSSTSSRSRFGEPDDSKWTIWPTTRQGDDCERRIADLEHDLDAAINAINQHAGKGKSQDEKIRELEQQVKDLTFEPVFTPFDSKGPMTIGELDEEEARSFVPVPMEQLIEQHNYNKSRSSSISTHSSMPGLICSHDESYISSDDSSIPDLETITEDEAEELACFKTRGELNRLYNISRQQDDVSDSDLEAGF